MTLMHYGLFVGTKMTMDYELKCVFLLRTLPTSWDTFCTIVSNSGNSAPNGKLVYIMTYVKLY